MIIFKMNSNYFIIFIILIIITIIIPKIYTQNPPPPQQDSTTIQIISKANSLFANDLYQVMTKVERDNFIISPFSLCNILAILRAGAGINTGKIIQNGLRLDVTLNESYVYDGYSQLLNSFKSDQNIIIETGNGVFIDKSYDIQDEYLDLIRNKFSAGVEALDFSNSEFAANKINTFIKDITKNNIIDLIDPSTITKDTKVTLVNGIYFKGLWSFPFLINNTKINTFYIHENNTIQIEMMKQNSKFPFAKIPELNATAAMLPYSGDRYGLIIVLPNERNGLNVTESKLNEFPLSLIPGKLKPTHLQISLPKFKIETTMDFVRNHALENLGMNSILSRTADFTRISPRNGLYLSQVLQKAILEINEEGTKASAASGAILDNRIAHIGVPFIVDHPFITFIYDYQTETILFVSKKIK